MRKRMRAWLCLGALSLFGCHRELPVLLYHGVGCGTDDPYDVPLDQFKEQLEVARMAGFHFVPLSQLVDPSASLPDKPLGLSFDDGARCVYLQAFPELLSRHVPFTLFLPARWLEKPHVQEVSPQTHWDTVNVAQVREMLNSDLAQVGSHGLTHARLPGLDDALAKSEIVDSATLLGAWFGSKPVLFAYPYGAFTGREVELVKGAGYAAAFGVGVGAGGRFAYRRRSIHAGLSRDAFLRELDTRWVWPLAAHD